MLAAACFACGGGALFWGDIGLYFQPLLELQSAALHGGKLALWNPFVLCGTPLVGNPQAWIFYPPAWAMALLPTPIFLTVINALHVFLGGAFTFAFLRRGALKLDLVPSLVGALTFMLGGYFFTKTSFPNMAAALCWLPLLLLFTERLVRRPSLRRALPLGVALAMQILAANAQITVFTIYLLALYGLWWLNVLRRRAPRVLARRLARTFGAALTALALALSLSCAQWLPVLDFLRATKRAGLTLREAHLFYLPPAELTNFFWPYRFGDPRTGIWGGYGTIVETSLYLGIVPCALALLAIFQLLRTATTAKNSAPRRSIFAKRNRIAEYETVLPAPSARRENAPLSLATRHEKAARFWLLISVVSVILALGAGALFYLLAWFLVPGVRAFRNPARMLMAASLGLPILAALGAQQFLTSRKTARAATILGAILVAATLLDLGFYARNFFPKRAFSAPQNIVNGPLGNIRKEAAMRNGQGRIWMPDSFASWGTFTDPATFGENDPRRYAQWQSTLTPNLGELYGLREAGGYDPIADRALRELTKRTSDLLLEKNPSPRDVAAVRAALRVLAVRSLVLFRAAPPTFPALTTVYRGPILSPRGERTFVVRNDDFAPRLHFENEIDDSSKNVAPRFVRDGFNGIEIAIPPQKRTRTLLLADSFRPGWQLFVDGRAQPFERRGLMRAVKIAPSKKGQRAVFVYRPQSFVLGFFVSLCALFAVTFSLCARRKTAR